jgi:uncharacterized protein (TIGR02186 family)
MNVLIPALFLGTWTGLGAAPSLQALQVDDLQVSALEVEPAAVQAGMFFDGATVTVSAIVPEELAVAVACVGPDERVVLNRKGKVFGLIWMNVEEVEFNDTPRLYQLNTSERLDRMASSASLLALGVGYRALEARAGSQGGEVGRVELFRELVRLKESEGLFAVSEGTVGTSPSGLDRTRVTTEFRLPDKTPPGEYEILLYGFSEGEGALLATGEVRLTQVGAASIISTLARDRGLLYGALAVVVAVAVGLLTGVVFSLGSKKGH